MLDIRVIGEANAGDGSASTGAKTHNPTLTTDTNIGSTSSRSGLLAGLESLLESLRTCEKAAEATRVVGEIFLTNACAQGLMQIQAHGGAAALVCKSGAPGVWERGNSETTVSHVGLTANHEIHIQTEKQTAETSLAETFALLAEGGPRKAKKNAMKHPAANLGLAEINGFLKQLSQPQKHETLEPAVTVAAICSRGENAAAAKRRKGIGSTVTNVLTCKCSPASIPREEALVLSQLGPMASAPGSTILASTGFSMGNALKGLRSSQCRHGGAKQSRISWRLASFRREAEEVLRGQHNEIVMDIFGAIDNHIRNTRGNSMSPADLDEKIMTVINLCLPLEGDAAKAAESVLDMTIVRKLKATLESRPKNSGTYLDLIALSKLCRHIPGVCFDKWNLGWIATWREKRRPVHKHFSAKKYGFFRAREFAICYRSKMTSDFTPEGQAPTSSSRSVIAHGDTSPFLVRSTHILNKVMAQQQLADRKTQFPEDTSRTPAAAAAVTAATATFARDSSRSAVGSASGSYTREHTDPSGALEAKRDTGEPLRMRVGQDAASPKKTDSSASAADVSAVAVSSASPLQQCRTSCSSHCGAGLPADAVITRDGWADLVALTPRVERVSFDFTNQSWIAQWKQHGRTTYRRFAVSKYGFADAHRLAVEYKSKYFKETPHPLPLASFMKAANDNKRRQQQASLAVNRMRHSMIKARRSVAHRQLALLGGASADRGMGWLGGELQRDADSQQGHNAAERKLKESSSSRDESGATFSETKNQQKDLLLQQLPRRTLSASNEDGRDKLASQAASTKSLCPPRDAPTSSIALPSGGADMVALEALLCSPLQMGFPRTCSAAAADSPDSNCGLDATSTTATTSYTHISMDAFPVSTVSSPGLSPDSGEREMHAERQHDLQKALGKVCQLNRQASTPQQLNQRSS